MLKEYSISKILSCDSSHIPYYAGTFEGIDYANDLEWPHRHSYYLCTWFTQGSGLFVMDFNEFEIIPGRLFLLNPKQVHNWDYSENSKGYVLKIDAFIGANLNIDCLPYYMDIKSDLAPFLKVVFENIICQFQQNQNIEVDIQYLYKILSRNANSIDVKCSCADPIVEKFKTLIFTEYDNMRSVEEYACKLDLSISDLNTICKEKIGVSAKQYILDLKITEAKRLLLYTDRNVNEVAYVLGFDDSAYFSRLFKRKTDFSPSDFLKKYRKQQ